MDNKKLTSQSAQPVNNLTIQELPIDLVELSEEALSQICGGSGFAVFGPLPATPPVSGPIIYSMPQ